MKQVIEITYHFKILICSKLIFFLELTCVPGFRRIYDWPIYLSSWGTWIPNGERTSNREICWRLAQENVGNANGIYWDFDAGYCRAVEHYQRLLPWPTSFPHHQSETKLCLKSELVGKNERKWFYQ